MSLAGSQLGSYATLSVFGRGVIVGRPDWQEQLAANKTEWVEQLFDEDKVSTSFGFTNEQYVDLLFQYAEVTPEQAERDSLVNGLDNGTQTRPTVFRKVVDDERLKNNLFASSFVFMEYVGYLRRDPDESGYNFWLNKLNQFNGDYIQSEMVRAFIISGEYRGRFGAQ